MVNLGFWGQLKKPILALAPLYDVTDPAFRAIIAKYSKPDVMFTEFASADGLCHPVGKEKIMRDMLKFGENERPIVAQLFTSWPNKMCEAAKLCAELKFDGIDINMGCPDETIEKQGSGACLIKNPVLAQELITAAKEGALNLPVSVKTRLGYNQIDLDWLAKLLAAEPAALIIHLRTRKEMSKVVAHWEVMPEIMKMAKDSGTLILGNGDVKTLAEARDKCNKYGCDGAMLGRAAFGNPWLFNLDAERPSEVERKRVLKEHIKLFTELLPQKNFASMKKHFKAYIEGWPGAHELRNKLMLAETAVEALDLL